MSTASEYVTAYSDKHRFHLLRARSRKCGEAATAYFICCISLRALFRLAENPGWPEEQENEQDRQGRHVPQSGPECKHRQGLREPERNPAEEGAERPTEPADDRRDEAGDRKRRSNVERGELGGRQQDAGDRAKGSTERKRQRQHARDRNSL